MHDPLFAVVCAMLLKKGRIALLLSPCRRTSRHLWLQTPTSRPGSSHHGESPAVTVHRQTHGPLATLPLSGHPLKPLLMHLPLLLSYTDSNCFIACAGTSSPMPLSCRDAPVIQRSLQFNEDACGRKRQCKLPLYAFSSEHYIARALGSSVGVYASCCSTACLYQPSSCSSLGVS